MKNTIQVPIRFALLSLLLSVLLGLLACGRAEQILEDHPEGVTEAELNAPVDGFEEAMEDSPEMEFSPFESYTFPAFDSKWGLSRVGYNLGKTYYTQNLQSFQARRYVVLIDLGLKSNRRRFFLLDLKTGQVSAHLTSHGVGSDTNNDGLAERFSNTPDSKMSSLGVYRTKNVYQGKYGRSLRLDGLSSTNSNAYARAIVIHGAPYVREDLSSAGRSWGCPALDHSVVQSVIDKIKNGALMIIFDSRK